MRLEGKVIMVTGAASGVGLAVARRCAHEGAQVLLCDGDEAAADAAVWRIAGELPRARPTLVPLRADAGNVQEMRDAVALALGRYGRLDGLVNRDGFDDPDAEYLARSSRPSGDDQLARLRAGLSPAMAAFAAQGTGNLLMLASLDELFDTLSHDAGHTPSRYARVQAWARGLARPGVRSLALCAGTQGETGRHPIRPIRDADEIGDLATWLLSDAAHHLRLAVLPVRALARHPMMSSPAMA